MRSHLRGGLMAAVFGFGALGGFGLAACTFAPRYPIEAGVAPGDGAQPILPRYPVHEGDARSDDRADDAQAAAPPRRAPPATEPAYGPPPPRQAPVESSDLPPPPAAAAYVEGEGAPVLIEAAVRHRKEAVLRGPARDSDDEAPAPRHGRRRHKAPEPQTTTVKPGENLYRISLRTHVPVEDLAKLNHIKAPYALKPGRVLDLPSSGDGAAQDEPETSSETKTNRSDEAVHTRHGLGFREETPRELRAEKAEQRRMEREEAAKAEAPPTRRHRGEPAEAAPATVSAAKAPAPASPAVSPEDLLPPAAAARRTPAAPAARDDLATSTAPTGGPRPYSEVFGVHPAAPRNGRGGRTHEDAAAAVAAAAMRHPTIGSAATAANAGVTEPAVAAPASARGRFLWPLRGEVISAFGPQASGGRNDGLDLAAAEGDPVHAAAAGEVVYAGGAIPGFGNLVLIKHAGGYVTAYGHLARIEVAMRQTVAQGAVLGEAGSTGNVAKPELHFEIRYSPAPDQSAKPVDPAPLLPPRN